MNCFENFLQEGDILKQYNEVKCQKCHEIFSDGVQMRCCGHLICRSCVEILIYKALNVDLVDKKVAQCPNEDCDKQLLGDESYESLDQSKEVNQLLATFMNHCHISGDCEWSGNFKDYEAHVKEAHPPMVFQEVPRKHSTHSLTSNNGAESISVKKVDPQFICSSKNTASPTKSTDQPQSFTTPNEIPHSHQMVCSESIATPESKSYANKSSEFVSGMSSPSYCEASSLQQASHDEASPTKKPESKTSPQRASKAKRSLRFNAENENPITETESMAKSQHPRQRPGPLQLRNENTGFQSRILSPTGKSNTPM